MKKISANYIFPGNSVPIKNGVVVIDDNGTILEILNPETNDINWNEIETHKGIICPGFVNTHCHLELSYLKGKLAEHTHLHGFVKNIIAVRDNFTKEERQEAILLADQEMLTNGIVAVGDISNGSSSFAHKKKSKLKYHTFLEVFGLNQNDANEIINSAKLLKTEYHQKNNISITTHAPYSMSTGLMSLVNEVSETILTIHNQETASENELFLTRSGALYEQLASFSEDIKKWHPTGKNSLPSYLENFSASKKTLLVHNTYTCKEDVAFANHYSDNIYWCFCPNANQYIERTQPDYELFISEKCTIGTDSLASNWSLSILDELKTISENTSTISLETLIKWATYNGAQFLGFDELGSIEKGKQPGLNLISNLDLINRSLLKGSKVVCLT